MVGRRRAREIEELKVKAREAERALRRAEEDKEELEHAQRDWKRRREDLESETERSKQELADVRQAMSQLRDALDASEKQANELEKEKTELRRSLEETSQRVEKLRKSNKSLSEELKTLQPTAARRRGGGLDSSNLSPRSSMDSRPGGVASPPPGSGARLRNGSIARSETPNTPEGTMVDAVYIKHVFLQFLEQKDKTHRQQLIPVLGKLLHFDE
jgi:prefoldin subunit 5